MKKPQGPSQGSVSDPAPFPAWEPEFKLDFANATAQKFSEIFHAFEESTKALGTNLPPLPFTDNGWHTITDQIAECLLRRNRPGTNRDIGFSTVQYYWRQMRDNMWKPTGQPVILNVEGWLQDAQHRLWAGYLGRLSFPSYVILDAPVIDKVFAYIDNVKVRTPAAALQTAKFNGLSSLISQTIQIASNYDIGAYTCYKTKHVDRMSPIQYIDYAEQHLGLKHTVRLVVANHKDAMECVGHKDITCFVAYKIAELFNEETCERFLEELAFPNDMLTDNDPLRALRVFLAKQAKSDDPFPKHLVLAHVIKAFNAWITNTPLKRVSVHTDDPFPKFVQSDKQETEEGQEAA